jgi:hypothetical protein
MKNTTRKIYPKEKPGTLYYERRGIREISIPTSDARAAGQFQKEDPESIAKLLNNCAHRLLERAGERKIKDVLGDAVASGANDLEANRSALLGWYANVAARRGLLSPIAMAAKFLSVQYITMHIVADGVDVERPDAAEEMDRRVKQILGFADAWHAWRLEAFGEHVQAFAGKTNKANLAKGKPAIHEKKRNRDDVILQVIGGMIGKPAPYISRYRFEEVNHVLSESGLDQFPSTGAFIKAVQRLQKSKRAAS